MHARTNERTKCTKGPKPTNQPAGEVGENGFIMVFSLVFNAIDPALFQPFEFENENLTMTVRSSEGPHNLPETSV